MNVGDTLYAISEAGITLTASKTKDTLKAYPAGNLTPELAGAIKEHKADIIRIMREDEEMRRTGKLIQSEREAFELAREFFAEDTEGGVSEMDTCRDAMAEKKLGSLIERRHDQCPKAQGEVADDVPENEKPGG